MSESFGRAVLQIDTASGAFFKDVDKAAGRTESLEKLFDRTAASARTFAKTHQQSFAAIGQAAGLLTAALGALAVGVVALGQRGSEVDDVAAGFRQMTGDLGDTGAVLAALRGSVDGVVSDFDLMQATNAGLSQGLRLSRDELTLTGEAARVLSDRIGGDTKAAFEQLLTAMATGRDRALALVGMNIDAAAAVETFARSIGKSSNALTENEQIIGKRNAILVAMRAELAASGRVESDFADRLQQVKVAVQNFTDTLGVAIATSPVVNAALGSIAEGLLAAFGDNQVTAVQTLIGYVNRFALVLTDVARVAVSVAEGILDGFYGVRGALFDILQGLAKVAMFAVDVQARILEAMKLAAPGTGRAIDAQLARLREVKQFAEAIGDSFGSTADQARQDRRAWSQTFDEMQQGIAATRGELERLVKAGASTDEIARRLRAVGGAGAQSAAQLRKLAAEEEKRAQQHRAFQNEIGVRRMETEAAAMTAAEQRAAAERQLQNEIGVGRMEAEAAELSRIETERTAWREYLNWLGERRMQADRDAMDLARRGSVLAEGLRETLRTQLGPTILRAFEGGGDVMKSVGGLLGGQLTVGVMGTIKDGAYAGGLGKLLADRLGKTIGGALGSMLPGLGTALGAGLGALADKVFGTLFGGEGRKVNDLRDQFTAAAGGIDQLAARAAAAGLTLDRFYRAKTVKEYEAAIRELDAAFTRLDEHRTKASTVFDQVMEAGRTGIPAAFQPAIDQLIALGLLTDAQAAQLRGLTEGALDVDRMRADLEMFGGSIDTLGPRFQQAQIDQTAARYINALDRMVAGGADMGRITHDAKEEISELVQAALKSGATLPEQMRHWVDALAAAGLLLDEHGKQITDTSQIKFGEPIKSEAEIAKEGWDAILEAIQALVDEIRGPLTDAIAALPDAKRIRVSAEYEGPPAPEFRSGIFRGRFSAAGTLVRLHDVESVVPRSDELAFALQVLAERAGPAPAAASSHNVVMLAMPGGGVGTDRYRIADEVMRLIPGGLATDRHFLRTSIERVVQDWVRTYGPRG